MEHSTTNPECTCRRLDGKSCDLGKDWIEPHVCCECGGIWTPVEGHDHMTPDEVAEQAKEYAEYNTDYC